MTEIRFLDFFLFASFPSTRTGYFRGDRSRGLRVAGATAGMTCHWSVYMHIRNTLQPLAVYRRFVVFHWSNKCLQKMFLQILLYMVSSALTALCNGCVPS